MPESALALIEEQCSCHAHIFMQVRLAWAVWAHTTRHIWTGLTSGAGQAMAAVQAGQGVRPSVAARITLEQQDDGLQDSSRRRDIQRAYKKRVRSKTRTLLGNRPAPFLAFALLL